MEPSQQRPGGDQCPRSLEQQEPPLALDEGDRGQQERPGEVERQIGAGLGAEHLRLGGGEGGKDGDRSDELDGFDHGVAVAASCARAAVSAVKSVTVEAIRTAGGCKPMYCYNNKTTIIHLATSGGDRGKERSMSSMCLRGVYVLDRTGTFDGPTDVVVEGGRIVSVTRDAPAGTHVDLDEFSGQWLMPGFVDCHAHLACWVDDTLGYLRMPVTRWTLELAANAKRLLEMGVTFVRDPGGADAGVRDSIADELVPGPQLQVAISVLSQTGGHADGFLPGPGLEASNGFLLSEYPSRPPEIADGVDGVRIAVRKILRAGADWLKICTTGGLLSPGLDHPDEAEFSLAEIEVAHEEASRKGTPMMVHAYGGEGLTNAVKAGARSIEHGLRLTEEQAALMAERGCWLVPTLAVMHELVSSADAGAFPAGVASKIEQIRPQIGEAVAVARAAGVRIAAGTDLITQRANLSEIVYLHESGLSEAEALLAATAWGAELCGVGDRLGRLEPGYRFDAIVVDEDPSGLECFRKDYPAAAVFQDGRLVHRRTHTPVSAA